MSGLFQNKYRIASVRLPGYDYGSEGLYFITVCTKGRQHFFGEIRQDMMCLSDIGAMVHNAWLATPDLRPDMNLQLGEFVVMPNHFHAILIIGDNPYNTTATDDGGAFQPRRDALRASRHGKEDSHCASGDARNASLPAYRNSFGPQAKNLASLMGGFKSSVTSFANAAEILFGWQPLYYDHIIRSYEDYLRIEHYIVNNIRNWKDDCFYQ